MPDLKHWETIERRLLLDRSPWMRLLEDDVRLPDGQIVHGYLRLETPGYVIVVPVDNAGQIGFVRSYKRGVDRIDLQPPAGVIDMDEDPLDCAQRELLEELGCQAEQYKPLGSFVLSGNYFGGRAHVFLGLGCQIIAEPNSGDLEEQQVVWLSQEEARRMWADGEFQQLSAVAALGLALTYIDTALANGALSFGVGS
jgi:ADP-ribose pyrophosphatase